MLKFVFSHLIKSHRLLLNSRATYIRGYWPEPITQQTLDEFLHDINYFERPDNFINIGLDRGKKLENKKAEKKIPIDVPPPVDIEPTTENVEEVFNLLSHDTVPPVLNYDDVKLEGEQLVNLAVEQGIFRDLFGEYVPSQDFIKFTPNQAERMNRLVPHYWLTDQPFARVDRHPKKTDPVKYFVPVVGISAKFIHTPKINSPEEDYAHTSYYGNIIPAEEALEKPSITLDGKLLTEENTETFITEKEFNNWKPGLIETVNFSETNEKFYSVLLLNLDYLHKNSTNLHWIAANIMPSKNCDLEYDELFEYLPVHGIRGFGYSRYVFLTLQHDEKITEVPSKVNDFSLEARKFDVSAFLERYKNINACPVGLSWFQTTWDSSSNSVFHDYIGIKAPVYEHVQAKLLPRPQKAYPGKVPFNLFLDGERDKKDLNKRVLLERLKGVDPYNYKDQYVPPKVPPTVFEDIDIPSWMKTQMFKKKNKLGIWRGLRPASALLPLDNNADLDYPLRPVAPSTKHFPDHPNQYPLKQFKAHKDLPTSKPPNEHQAVFIQESHECHIDKAIEIIEKGSKSNQK